MSEIQAPPFCVQIEPTEGCPLMCKFCGINGIRKKAGDYKLMSLDTAERISSELARLKWNSRIEIAMHGEPTVNDELINIIATFRRHLPKSYIMMESNGYGFRYEEPNKFVKDLREAGLNCLALDEYQNCPWVPDTLKELSGNIKWIDYPDDPYGNPHQRNTKDFRVVRIRPITESQGGTHATLCNHCGLGAPLNNSAQGKRCAKPFRELSFRWDGKVSICCNDWRGYIKAGDIKKESLDSIWNGPIFQSARRLLLEGRRDAIKICNGCDALSYRPGLLPDMKGQVELMNGSNEDIKLLANCAKGFTMAPVNLRPWEAK